MPVLLLDNFLDTRFSNWYSRYYCDDLEVMRASEGKFPDDLAAFSHLILSGSEASIVDDHDWAETEMELVREALRLKLPTLGLCFGHQLIARALLGPAGVRRSSTPEFGWKKVRLAHLSKELPDTDGVPSGRPPARADETLTSLREESPAAFDLFAGLPGSFHIFNAHFDEVCHLDERFQVLAGSAGCRVQAFKVRRGPVWGLQFHPEISLEIGKRYLRTFPDRYPGYELDVEAVIAQARDDEVSERLFVSFYTARREAQLQPTNIPAQSLNTK